VAEASVNFEANKFKKNPNGLKVTRIVQIEQKQKTRQRNAKKPQRNVTKGRNTSVDVKTKPLEPLLPDLACPGSNNFPPN
jgi:hypothetical protein